MNIVKTKKKLEEVLSAFRKDGHKINFIPTMGALHEGHLSLLKQGIQWGGKTVCSIFVNPTQFNDQEDLKKYPRPLEQDVTLLESVGCDLLFLPDIKEMYEDNEEEWSLDLGRLDRVLEGEKRPGHFQGVTQIVFKLFIAVKPDRAIFGQKDLQQFLVIEEMVRLKDLPVQLIMGTTIREASGLALSSRNVRLSEAGKKKALVLSMALQYVEAHLPHVKQGHLTLADLRQEAITLINDSPDVSLEYFAICDRTTLLEANNSTPHDRLVALVAAWVEGVRLIDNVVLK